jgi:FixJ family two-component response regulator
MAFVLPKESAPGPNGRHSVVVVIDDDPAVLGALKFSLELEGFQVDTYRGGRELLAESRLPQAGCLVIDYKLPEMDGLDLLAALRRRNVLLPAILITSHPTAALRRRAAEVSTPIIEKPLLGDALTSAIRSSLEGQSVTAH